MPGTPETLRDAGILEAVEHADALLRVRLARAALSYPEQTHG